MNYYVHWIGICLDHVSGFVVKCTSFRVSQSGYYPVIGIVSLVYVMRNLCRLDLVDCVGLSLGPEGMQ